MHFAIARKITTIYNLHRIKLHLSSPVGVIFVPRCKRLATRLIPLRLAKLSYSRPCEMKSAEEDVKRRSAVYVSWLLIQST